MKTIPNKMSKLFLAASMTALLSACGATTPVEGFDSNGIDLSSRSAQDGGQTVARCNQITGSGFSGLAQVYSLDGQIYDEMSRLRLNTLPTSFTQAGEYLEFYRWYSDETGNSIDNQAASFYLENRQSGQAISGTLTRLLASDITKFSQQAFGQTMTASTFLGRVNIVISGLSLSFDAIKLVHFAAGQASRSTDFLIPGFAADPNEYAGNHPASLVQLHPNFSAADDQLEVSSYLQMTEAFCF